MDLEGVKLDIEINQAKVSNTISKNQNDIGQNAEAINQLSSMQNEQHKISKEVMNRITAFDTKLDHSLPNKLTTKGNSLDLKSKTASPPLQVPMNQMNNVKNSFAKRLTADRNKDHSEAIRDSNCPLEKMIARKPELKANTKHKRQKQTETRDRDELLFPKISTSQKLFHTNMQNKARSEAAASPGNVTSDEEKQHQQIKPQQSENLYIKTKKWISYLPLNT